MRYNLSLYQTQSLRCARGEIGKHNRLKICRLHGLVGSSPTERTTFLKILKINEIIYLMVNLSSLNYVLNLGF